MTTPTPEFEMSAEEAERRTNRKAFMLLGAGLLFICAPTMMCFPEYRMAAIIIGVGTLATSTSLIILLTFLQLIAIISRYNLKKRKQRFLSAEELKAVRIDQITITRDIYQ